jgi:cell division protein FtsI/penicillin-binding protein 2
MNSNDEFMKEAHSRFRVISVVIFIGFFLLFLRVYYLTFLNNKNTDQSKNKKVQRGIIFDRRGMELALSHDSSTIGINPIDVYDASFTSSKIARLVNIPEDKIEQLISEKEKYFLLKREIDNINADKIKGMGLPGVRIEKEFKRVYPNGSLASNLIGFAGKDDNKALSGLEVIYNEELLTPTDEDIPRGYDIHLTIDALIQQRLESSLGKAFIETKSKKAIGIFMEIHTGKVLAMASFPNFDPNRYWEFPAESTTNWAIRHLYEPGSTMKIFLAAILLNEKLINLNEKYFCPGKIDVGDRIVRCNDQHGLVDIDEIIQYSCNVGIIEASGKIPEKVLYEYLNKLKFGHKTGFSTDEKKSSLPPFKDWTSGFTNYLAIGQGIEVTPLQLITSAASIVNGGKLNKPLIVSRITNSYGDIVKQFTPDPINVGIDEKTTEHILRAMSKVVKMGTGKNAYIQDYAIAGKTGTSQKAKPGRGYTDGLLTASFLGFFPANNPKIVGLILFDEPGGFEHSGGGIAAPVFKQVVENIIPMIDYQETSDYYTLSDLNLKNTKVNSKYVPDFHGKSVKESIEMFQNFNIKYKIYGSGFCVHQYPEKGQKVKNGDVWSLHFE